MVAELHNRQVVRVPDLTGHPLTKAKLILANAGLTVDAVLFRESYEDQDVVLEQKPTRGQMVYEGAPVTLWVARRGYMELLPAIYRRSDALGRNVVRDICFIFEHMFGSIEEKLDDGHRFFDPHECPPDFLPWLASWTAMVVDMDWPEAKKRAVVKRGVDIYRTRGTLRGLSLTLKLFTGVEPRIEENKWPFKGFRVGTDARVSIDSVVLPPVELGHCFMITMPMKFTDVSPEMVIRIHQLIRMEKPAHTHYYLQFEADKGETELREFFAIGVRSGIGIGAEVVEDEAAPMGMGIGVAAAAVETSEPEPEPEPTAPEPEPQTKKSEGEAGAKPAKKKRARKRKAKDAKSDADKKGDDS
jgi:phage tail-like protein